MGYSMAAYAAIQILTAPSAPKLPKPPAMPDQQAALQSGQLDAAKAAAARQGRASTLLSSTSDVGQSEKLGP